MPGILENVSMFAQKALILTLGRALALLLAVALGACAGTGSPATPEAAASRPIAASRGGVAPPPPPTPPVADPGGPPTVQQARAECWMSMETNKKAPKDPEKRLPLVEKCVQDKMSASGAPPAQAPQ